MMTGTPNRLNWVDRFSHMDTVMCRSFSKLLLMHKQHWFAVPVFFHRAAETSCSSIHSDLKTTLWLSGWETYCCISSISIHTLTSINRIRARGQRTDHMCDVSSEGVWIKELEQWFWCIPYWNMQLQ